MIAPLGVGRKLSPNGYLALSPFLGPGNGFPMATNVVLVVLVFVLGVVFIRFSKY